MDGGESGKVLLWAAERPERRALVVPPGVEVVSIPRPPQGHRDLSRVEILVPPYRSRAVLEALPEMPALRLVQSLESGVEWLLPHVPPGVTVCNAKGTHDAAVAEWVLGAILAMQRRLPDHLIAQRQALWRDVVSAGGWMPPFAGDLERSTVLIVGYGSIGAAVERRLAPFGVEILRIGRRGREGVAPIEALPDLVGQADVVVLLLPLTETTRGVISTSILGSLRPGALLVNAGRGPLVDQAALLEELCAGRLRAALDVTDPEPLPVDDPLWSAPNLLLTPHIAGDTPRRYQRSWELVGAQVGRLMAGDQLENIIERC